MRVFILMAMAGAFVTAENPFVSRAQEVSDESTSSYIDRELFPEAYGILSSENLMFPVDVSDWPVRIDEKRQLFVDDYLIASKTNLEREYHLFKKYPGNPIMVVDRPWEEIAIIVLFVHRREESGTFQMWYSTRLHYEEPGGTSVRFPTLYAESDDGVHWKKPNLGLLEFNGSKENNFVIHGGRISGLFVNEEAPNPDERYVALVWHEPDYVKREGYFLYKSSDGVRWSGNLEKCILPSQLEYKLPTNGIGDTSIFRFDHLLGRYVCSVKFVLPHERLGKIRTRGYSESEDLIHWTRPVFTLYPDEHDEPDTQIYGNIEFPYESMWLGLLRAMHMERTGFKQVEIELSTSRDGRTWSRPTDRVPILPLGEPESWDPDYTDPVHNGPVLVGDELWLYYRGSRHKTRVHEEVDWKYASMETGLATLRRDGFSSLNAGEEAGSIVTRPLEFSGDRLYMNAEIDEDGWISVEALSDSGVPLENLTVADCGRIQTGGLEIPVTWKKSQRATLPNDGHIRLRFQVKRAKIYSFWIENSASDSGAD